MLYILDGSGFLFRAYYSLPSINDKNGSDASAIFGFFRMVLKLLQDKPSNFIIAFDPGKKTKRMEEFKEYKANRPKIEDKFKNQIPLIIDICKQVGFNVEIIQEYEADDVICSIVKNCSNIDSFIISSDKDLKQLISDRVKFLEPKTMQITDSDGFLQEYGFESKGMVLYLALLGDSSDNIPGIPGIGKKTAADIVSKFTNLEDLTANLDQLSPKIAEKIGQNIELLKQNINLISLYEPGNYNSTDILNKSGFDNINFDKLKNILINEYGFKSFDKIIDNLLTEIKKPTQMSLF